jgi:response regulator NasT
MNSALIVSNTEKSNFFFIDMLSQSSCEEIVTVQNCGEARRLLARRNFDLCIVNTPLSDEFGDKFALHAIAKDSTQVIIIVKNQLFDEVSSKVEDMGVFTIAKPLSKAMFWSALKLVNAAIYKTSLLRNENQKLLQKIVDIRLVDRAKCILIQLMSMTEAEAHKYIEKQAMDMRLPKKTVAENIIRTYDN